MEASELIISASLQANRTASGFYLSCCNSSTLRVTFGWFIDDWFMTGFLKRISISSFTAAVAVAVNTVCGIVGNSDFNLLSPLNMLLISKCQFVRSY